MTLQAAVTVCVVVSVVSLGDVVGILVCANRLFDVCTMKKPRSIVFSECIATANAPLCVCISMCGCNLKECDTVKCCTSVFYDCIGT